MVRRAAHHENGEGASPNPTRKASDPRKAYGERDVIPRMIRRVVPGITCRTGSDARFGIHRLMLSDSAFLNPSVRSADTSPFRRGIALRSSGSPE